MFKKIGVPENILAKKCLKISQLRVSNNSSIGARITAKIDLRGPIGTDTEGDFRELGDKEWEELNIAIKETILARGGINNLRPAEIGVIVEDIVLGWFGSQIEHMMWQYVLDKKMTDGSEDQPKVKEFLRQQSGIVAKDGQAESNFERDLNTTIQRFNNAKATYKHLIELSKNEDLSAPAMTQDITDFKELLKEMQIKIPV